MTAPGASSPSDKAEQPVRFARYAAKLVGGRTVEGETDNGGIAL